MGLAEWIIDGNALCQFNFIITPLGSKLHTWINYFGCAVNISELVNQFKKNHAEISQ